MNNPRIIANKVIFNLVQNKQTFAKTLPTKLANISSAQQKSFIQELCYGVARWYSQLDFIAKKIIKKPLKAKDLDIYILIIIGLYELMYLRTPQHAVINENVNNARHLNKQWACGLINAVLRGFSRQKTTLLKTISSNIEAKFAHPKWLINKIRRAYPKKWPQILKANNARPPMSLRVNLQQISREKYLQKVNAYPCPICPTCITMKKPCAVTELPGFTQGEVSVQDCGAQFAAKLLALKPKQRVLDACAAPGGKTMHILETETDLQELIAIDNNIERLRLVANNLQRIKSYISAAKLIHADISKPESWWDHKPFDRILLDAPCSATGVIRRHPDIKLLKTATDITNLAAQQLTLLKTIWPLLKQDGRLVYVTCSLLPEENDHVISKFLLETANAHIQKVNAPWGIATQLGQQILPGQDNMDGFYYAAISKKL